MSFSLLGWLGVVVGWLVGWLSGRVVGSFFVVFGVFFGRGRWREEGRGEREREREREGGIGTWAGEREFVSLFFAPLPRGERIDSSSHHYCVFIPPLSILLIPGTLRPFALKPHPLATSSPLGSLVDSLDTLWLMGLKDEFWEGRDYVRDKLRFDRVGDVSFFETTIRNLGGLLSAYDLSKDVSFLNKADDLGLRLSKAYDTPSGMPHGSVHLGTGISNK